VDGCIALFTAIDPDVEHIYTFAGEAVDTSYHRDRIGQWHALWPEETVAVDQAAASRCRR
jgi:hypothetical protein